MKQTPSEVWKRTCKMQMAALDYNQEKLAKKIGTSRKTVSVYINDFPPTYVGFRTMIKALNFSDEQILQSLR